ncbi:MAG: hypothetical protein KF771_10345 [Burkholderiales bacterium]|nr:hypothetical protein [Burkholderiales bacterium]
MAQHFELIANYPDPSLTGGLRETCRRLRADWERIGAEREQLMRKAMISGAPEVAAGPLH